MEQPGAALLAVLAAALLYVLPGVRQVYAGVMSEHACRVFAGHGIPASFRVRVGAVRNRAGTGFCPMETAVRDVDDPAEALPVIEETLRRLQQEKQGV